MTLIQPFRALRPAPGRAAEVLAPPYDVLSSEEARVRAEGKPWSFLHVSKPEIDLAPDVDPHDAAVYAKAAENLERMVAGGVLVRDAAPSYYVYRLTRQGRSQTGLAAIASLADYRTNRIRKHELTTPVKEDDRVHQIEAVNAQTGPVMIAYPAAPAIDAHARRRRQRRARGRRHLAGRRPPPTLDDPRSGQDRRAHPRRRRPARRSTSPTVITARPPHPALPQAHGNGSEAQRYFLAVLFPEHEMTILDYNRLLRDLNGHTPAALLPTRQAICGRAGGRAGPPWRSRPSSACSSTAAGTG